MSANLTNAFVFRDFDNNNIVKRRHASVSIIHRLFIEFARRPRARGCRSERGARAHVVCGAGI